MPYRHRQGSLLHFRRMTLFQLEIESDRLISYLTSPEFRILLISSRNSSTTIYRRIRKIENKRVRDVEISFISVGLAAVFHGGV